MTSLRALAILAPVLAIAGAAASAPGEARAAQLRRDAIAALGGASGAPTLRLEATGGLPIAGRSSRPGVSLWSGFWFPRPAQAGSAPEAQPEEAIPLAERLPLRTRLAGFWPNPVRGTASLRFEIAPAAGGSAAATTPTRVELYDVNGRRVATLFDRSSTPGFHQFTWDARGEERPVANGIYLLRFESGDHSETRRLVLLR